MKAKTNVKHTMIRDILFEDYAAIAADYPSNLEFLIDCLSNACTNFRLTIASKKKCSSTRTTSPNITINDYQLKVVDELTYLGSNK